MFDPSFFELIIICVVALLVLGPDKLPGAIKTLGLWIGRLRRSFNNIKREIEQEVGADEIRRQLRNEAIMEKFNSTKNQVTQSIQSVKKEAEAVKDELNLKKELSGDNEQSAVTESIDDSDEIDPVEMLATKDPAARTIKTGQTGTADNNVKPGTDTNRPKEEAPATDSGEPAAAVEGTTKATTGNDNSEDRKNQSGA